MRMTSLALSLAALAVTSTVACAQDAQDPFPNPIPAQEGAITVNYTEFAVIPPYNGNPARMMTLVTQPGTLRMFVSDMAGPIYGVSYDGRTVIQYVDVNSPTYGVNVQAQGNERGVQSIAFHPDFNEAGRPGFGKFYTWLDSSNMTPTPDFTSGGANVTHHTVLYEWTARTPGAPTYDGGAPREIFRFAQPFQNHNGGGIGFNPLSPRGSPDFGMLYVGVGDGGSGGDPMNLAQNLANGFGKLLRIDPLGTNSSNGKYGIPADNPFAQDGNPATLGEIYAYGLRNPQRFTWDPANGNLILADIGQNVVEKVTLVPRGGNLGWNTWEGSFSFLGGRAGVALENPRGDPNVTFPIAEYAQSDPLLQGSSAATGVHVFRNNTLPRLNNMLVFGDMPSGEVFYVSADRLPNGGQDPIRRVLFNDRGTAKPFLQLVREQVQETPGATPPTRADMRFGYGPNGQLLLINKRDGVIRLLVPEGM